MAPVEAVLQIPYVVKSIVMEAPWLAAMGRSTPGGASPEDGDEFVGPESDVCVVVDKEEKHDDKSKDKKQKKDAKDKARARTRRSRGRHLRARTRRITRRTVTTTRTKTRKPRGKRKTRPRQSLAAKGPVRQSSSRTRRPSRQRRRRGTKRLSRIAHCHRLRTWRCTPRWSHRSS
jgi:hypothetical protein